MILRQTVTMLIIRAAFIGNPFICPAQAIPAEGTPPMFPALSLRRTGRRRTYQCDEVPGGLLPARMRKDELCMANCGLTEGLETLKCFNR